MRQINGSIQREKVTIFINKLFSQKFCTKSNSSKIQEQDVFYYFSCLSLSPWFSICVKLFLLLTLLGLYLLLAGWHWDVWLTTVLSDNDDDDDDNKKKNIFFQRQSEKHTETKRKITKAVSKRENTFGATFWMCLCVFFFFSLVYVYVCTTFYRPKIHSAARPILNCIYHQFSAKATQWLGASEFYLCP